MSPTHDYIIDNSTGANVRADINNALAAIVSNNSSSSEPSTTYAYQWWADTNENVLKIRNSSNNAWVTLLELDGTLTLEDGSNSAPALGFRDDLNTGIFSSSADNLDITCGGTTRANFSSSGLTVTGNVTATTFVGNVDAVDGDFDGTLEADAITVGGTALATVIAGTTVTTATNANHISVADNESTNENNLIPFIEDASATGNVGLESDGDFTYNPSTGTVTATAFTGNLTGNVTGNSSTSTTSTNVTAADESSDTTCFPLFVTAATGDLPPKTGSNLAFNSSSGLLTATAFSGDGSALTGIAGGGKFLQVVQTVYKTDQTFSTQGSFFDTGVSASITPSASDSKVLIRFGLTFQPHGASAIQFRILRGSTVLEVGVSGGGTQAFLAGSQNGSQGAYPFGELLDTPSTTSSTTYKIQAQVDNADSRINGRDTDYRACSTITLVEVGN